MQIALTQTFDDYQSSKTYWLPQVVFGLYKGEMPLRILYDLLLYGIFFLITAFCFGALKLYKNTSIGAWTLGLTNDVEETLLRYF